MLRYQQTATNNTIHGDASSTSSHWHLLKFYSRLRLILLRFGFCLFIQRVNEFETGLYLGSVLPLPFQILNT